MKNRREEEKENRENIPEERRRSQEQFPSSESPILPLKPTQNTFGSSFHSEPEPETPQEQPGTRPPTSPSPPATLPLLSASRTNPHSAGSRLKPRPNPTQLPQQFPPLQPTTFSQNPPRDSPNLHLSRAPNLEPNHPPQLPNFTTNTCAAHYLEISPTSYLTPRSPELQASHPEPIFEVPATHRQPPFDPQAADRAPPPPVPV